MASPSWLNTLLRNEHRSRGNERGKSRARARALRPLLRSGVEALEALIVLLFGVGPPPPPPIVVNSLADGVNPADFDETLREAILDVNAGLGSAILFDGSLLGQTIALGSDLPQITHDVTITGPG